MFPRALVRPTGFLPRVGAAGIRLQIANPRLGRVIQAPECSLRTRRAAARGDGTFLIVGCPRNALLGGIGM